MQDDQIRSLHSRSAKSTLETAVQSPRAGDRSTFFSAVWHGARSTFSPLITAWVAIILVGITLYVGWVAHRSSRDNVRRSLETVLAANVKALQLWMEEEHSVARQIAADESIRRAAMRRLSTESIEATDQHFHHQPAPIEGSLLETFRTRAVPRGHVGWLLLDSTMRIAHASVPRLIGTRVPLAGELKRRLESGEVAVTQPIRLAPRGPVPNHPDGAMPSRESTRSPGSGTLPDAVMLCIAPLRQDLQTEGSIALIIDPEREFSDTVSLAQLGQTGETYAFNRDAVMVSRSRFLSKLRQTGLLNTDQSSCLNVRLRVPDGRRNRNADSATIARWPLTRMAEAATRGGTGTDVIGYPSYRGTAVVGAWRWLPEYDIGVATEMEVQEAYEPLRNLRNAFVALFSTTAIAGGVLLGLARIGRRGASPTAPTSGPGRRLGQYDLQRPIGRGGMGTVYLGTHRVLERKVAVKVLENADVNERARARFQREVQLSARLMHPNTIEIYDFGATDDGTFFYVMEFVDGLSLEQLVDHYGRQPAERVIYVLLQICGSIAEAHEAGMVHRDLKPANVLLTSRSGIHDMVKVLDFGLAKRLDQESMQLTRTDGLTGTPLYMSPESIRDASAADERSDLYAIGAIGYTLLCGVPPFDGDCSADVCAKKLNQELPASPESRIGAPVTSDLQRVLMRCLHLDPTKRPPSARQLAVELMSCQDSPHWTQQDAALWWREVFDGPYPEDFNINDRHGTPGGDHGTRGDTAVNAGRSVVNAAAQSTVS